MKACLHTFCAVLTLGLASQAYAVTATDTPTMTVTESSTVTVTPTLSDTPTMTPSPTLTATPTPGEGSLVISPASLVSGSSSNAFQVTYQSGASAWVPGGLLTLYFPLGLGTPNNANFYVQPAQASLVPASGYNFNGQTVSVQVNGLAASSPIAFWYGYNSSAGIFVSSTQATESFNADAFPQSVTLGAGGRVGVTPGVITIVTATHTPTITETSTVTPTLTITETFTITQTFSASPTFSVSPTHTITLTSTPIGQVEPGVYSYPNPFDIKKFEKCTFRFPSDPDARVTVFNLVGEPVRELPLSDINGGQGWAIWPGLDDYLRKVPGGLYYVRIRGKETHIRKFTVLN